MGNEKGDGSAIAPPALRALERIQAEDECRYVSASRHYPGQVQLEGHFPAEVLRRIAAALEASGSERGEASQAEPQPDPSLQPASGEPQQETPVKD